MFLRLILESASAISQPIKHVITRVTNESINIISNVQITPSTPGFAELK